MPELKQILEAAGVWGWLCDQCPDLSEREILAAVDGDFREFVEDLLKKETPPGEAAGEGR